MRTRQCIYRTRTCQSVPVALRRSNCSNPWQHPAAAIGSSSQARSCRRASLPPRAAGRSRKAAVVVKAIDAAQPFDGEYQARRRLAEDKRLTIGIVGFGNFGQFLAKRMVARGHRVLATSRSPYDAVARQLGVDYFRDPDDFCEEHPDVVLLASSILSTEPVLRSLPVQRLRRNTLFVDVLSVKVFPKELLLSVLPPEVDILCTHPMFGPDSGRGSWQGLNFQYERVRILSDDPKRIKRCENFLAFFRDEGCRMVEMSCEEHDRQAASTQFVTHTVGRMLGAMELQSTEINTKGFESLLNLVNNTVNDSFDLYYGLYLYNENATEELYRLEQAFELVKKQLFSRLHDIARAQIFPGGSPADRLRSQALGNTPQLLLPQGNGTGQAGTQYAPHSAGQGEGQEAGTVSAMNGAGAAARTIDISPERS